jgi:hypothetical protein
MDFKVVYAKRPKGTQTEGLAQMNQEQLLDHVAELVRNEAKNGPGAILLLYKDNFSILRLPYPIDPDAIVVHVFNSKAVIDELAPSAWLKLSKEIWTCFSSKPHANGTLKFPTSVGGKAARRKPPEPESPKSG